jgi:enoyl-CoA hydratase
MGFSSALDAYFTLHQLNHAHWSEVSGGRVICGTPEYGLDDWRDAPAIFPARKSHP